jgi:hypothetical protein
MSPNGADSEDDASTAADEETGTEAEPEPVEAKESESETDADAEGETDADGDTEPSEAATDEPEETEPEADPDSISRIDVIRVDPEAVIEAIAYNGQEDIGQKSKTVFTLSPPFKSTVEPTLQHLEEETGGGDPNSEIKLRPFRFVAEGRQIVDQRPTRKLALENLDSDDPTEATIEAWIDEAMEVWKDHIRENLVGSVDIFTPQEMEFVSVEYDPEPESEA